MSATLEASPVRKPPMALNGVDVPALFATIDVVRNQPELGRFQFRAEGSWISGTHMQTTMSNFSGAGGEHEHKRAFTAEADHPAVLCATDNAPTPVECTLHALAACLTAGVASIASARGVRLTAVDCTLFGDIDLRGVLGLAKDVRNGFSGIRAVFSIEGDAPRAKLQEILEQSRARSAVFDMLTNGVPVSVELQG